jgi:ribosomal protein S18 acetylase RimI-like enzyme
MLAYTIRPAVPKSDLQALTTLARDTADEAQGFFSSRRMGSDLQPSPFNGSYVFVAEADEDRRLVGFVIIRFTDIPDSPRTHASRRVDVMMLGVVPQFRRQGIARKLMWRALDHAKDMNATVTTLCVSERNRAAIALYESMGWQPIDRMMVYNTAR